MQRMGAQAPKTITDDAWGEIEILDGPEEVDAHVPAAPASDWGEIEILSQPDAPESDQPAETWVGRAADWVGDTASKIGRGMHAVASRPDEVLSSAWESLPTGVEQVKKGTDLLTGVVAPAQVVKVKQQGVDAILDRLAQHQFPYEGDEGRRRSFKQDLLGQIKSRWAEGRNARDVLEPYLKDERFYYDPSTLPHIMSPPDISEEEAEALFAETLPEVARHEAKIQDMTKERLAELPPAYGVMSAEERLKHYPGVFTGELLGQNAPAQVPGLVGMGLTAITKNPVFAAAGTAAFAPQTANELWDAVGEWEQDSGTSLPTDVKAQAVAGLLIPHMGVEQASNLVAAGLAPTKKLTSKVLQTKAGRKVLDNFMSRFLSRTAGAGLTEGAEEVVQGGIGQVAKRRVSDDDSIPLVGPDSSTEFAAGALMGGAMSGPLAATSSAVESVQRSRAERSDAEKDLNKRGLVDEDAVRESQREQFNTILDLEEQLRARGVDLPGVDRAGWRALAMYANENGVDAAVETFQGLKAGGDAVSQDVAAEIEALRQEFGVPEADAVEAEVLEQRGRTRRQQQEQTAQTANPVEDMVRRTAQNMGFDEATALAIADIESNIGRAENRPGSQYQGVFQMGEDAAADVGIDPATRNDPAVNIRAGIAYARINEERLRAQGVDLEGLAPEERAAMLYLAHNQGAGGAAEIYRAAMGQGEVSDETRRNMLNQSRELRSDDPVQFLDNVRRAMGTRMARFGGDGESAGVAAMFNDVQDSWRPEPEQRDTAQADSLRQEVNALRNRPDAESRRRYIQALEELDRLEQQPERAGISTGYAAREQAARDEAARGRRSPSTDAEAARVQRERNLQAQEQRRRTDEELQTRAGRQRGRGQADAAERTEALASPAIRLTLDDVDGMDRASLLDTARGMGFTRPEKWANRKLRQAVRREVAEKSREGVYELMRRVDEDTARLNQTQALPEGQGFEAVFDAPQRVDGMKRGDLLKMGRELDLGLSAKDSNQAMRRAIKSELQRRHTSLEGNFVGETDQAPGVSVEGNDSDGTTLGPFRSRYKDGDAVGRISDESAAEINSFGFDTAPSDVTVTDRDIDYIEGRHGDQLDDDDVANLTRVIADPTEILPNISTDQSPQRDRSVLFVRKNGKSYVSIVEISVGDGDNRLWNYWKMRPEKAEKYLAKFRDEKTRRQQPGGATSSSYSSLPGAPGVGKPEGLSGSQATDAGEKNITPDAESDKGAGELLLEGRVPPSTDTGVGPALRTPSQGAGEGKPTARGSNELDENITPETGSDKGAKFRKSGKKENSRVLEGQSRPTIGRGAQVATGFRSPAQGESGGLQLPKESPDVQDENNIRAKSRRVNKRLSTPAQARMVDDAVSKANEHLGADTVVALHHPDDIPPHIRRMMSYNDMGAAGFYQDGRAYVMGWNASATDVADTIAHELTHAGLDRARIENAARKARGEKARTIRDALADVNATLDDIYRSRKADIDRLTAPGAPYEGAFDMRTTEGRRKLTEEWLAAHPLRGEHAWYDRYVAALRRLLRAVGEAMGLDLDYSDIEIRNLLWQSSDQLRARHIAMRTGMPAPIAPAFQRTWHGSAKDAIERFALQYIGSGAGGRVFGWGFYLTGDFNLADRYRQLALGKQGTPETGGAVYEVEIPDNHRLLDWDTPITKQPHYVQYAFRAAHRRGMFEGKYADMSKLTGGDGYYRVKDWLYMRGHVPEGKSADQVASEWFANEGVHGNRHKNDYGSESFVVWKEDALEIVNRLVGGRKPQFKKRGKDIEDNPVTAPAVGVLDRAPTLGEMQRYAEETGEKDLGTTRELLGTLQWLAKDHPSLLGFFESTRRRTQKRMQGFRHSTEPVAELLKDMDKKQRRELVEVVWEIEGKKVKGQTEKAFREVEEDGETFYEVNEAHFAQLRDILVKHGVDQKVAETVAAMRKSFDESLALTWRVFARKAPKNKVAKLRQSFGRVHNYFPRMRFGDYYIRATDPKTGEVVYREHFDAMLLKTRKGRKLIEERKKAHPEWKWEAPKKVQGLPEEVYDSPVQTEAVAQIIRAAAQKTLGQESDAYKDFERALMESAADVFKSRGHGSRMIRRSERDIGGYEKADIEKVFYSYHSGFNGWLTKMEAAMEYHTVLSEIDAQKTPRVYAWAKRYARDMLENSTRFDRSMDKTKTWIFFQFLGLAISTAAVNMTQNFVLGLPRLGMEVGTVNATNSIFGGSAASIRKGITNKKGTHLSEDELSMLKDLHERGELDSQFMNEVLGSSKTRAGKFMGAVLNVAGWPMAMTEKFNRASMALSAYRAARKGKIKRSETLKKYGYTQGQKFSHEDAVKFADEITIDTNFWIDKGNRPQIARGGKGGKIVNVFMTFRTFLNNMLQCWRWMATQGGAGRLALAQSIAMNVLVGGMKAFPVFATFMAAWRWLTGDEPEDKAYEWFGQTGGRIALYGVFAPLGITLSSSLKLDFPVISRIDPDKNIGEQLVTGTLEAIVGAGGSALASTINSGIQLFGGNFRRAFEEFAPRSIANVSRALTGYDEGKTTRSGRGINRFGKAEPRKYDASEAILKGLSFQLTEDNVMYDEYFGRKQARTWKDRKADDFSKMFLEGYREGDSAKMRRAMGKWRNHNIKYKDEPHKMIKTSPKERVKRLLRPDLGPTVERGWAKERDALRYGED